MHSDVVIIGGGVTGLAVARSMNLDACLFEKEAALGGCLRSDHVDGYTIDRTGHLLHFQDPFVRQVMFDELSLDWLHFERCAEIRMLDRSIPYPVQYNLHALPAAQREWCLQSYLDLDGRGPPLESSFEQWSCESYGEGLHQLFFAPYNRKLWRAPLSSISAEWARRFVPMPDRELILTGAHRPQKDGRFGYNATFSYPRTGGSQAIVEALAGSASIPIHMSAELISIDPVARICAFSNGSLVSYGVLVSTIPLPVLLRRVHKVEPHILALAQGLRHNSVFYFALGYRVPGAMPAAHWIYVPEERFSMYRVGILSNYSPHVAPDGSILVCAEIGCEADSAAFLDPDQLRRRVLEDLERIGLVQPTWELELVHHGSIDCAYVIFDAHRRNSLPRIQAYLRNLGILSVGRYGAWDYGSMGDALIEGRHTAELINQRFGQFTRVQA